jgi:hypothetical protein
MIISNITLALLEDSGWYMPDYSLAEPMWWGKNRGCDFTIYNKCPNGSPQSEATGEFCTYPDNTWGCDVYGDDKSVCTKQGNLFAEGCPVDVSQTPLIGDCWKAQPSSTMAQILGDISKNVFKEKRSENAKCFRVKSMTQKKFNQDADVNYYPICYEYTCVFGDAKNPKKVTAI